MGSNFSKDSETRQLQGSKVAMVKFHRSQSLGIEQNVIQKSIGSKIIYVPEFIIDEESDLENGSQTCSVWSNYWINVQEKIILITI